MKKKIIHLTQSELKEVIDCATGNSETEGGVYNIIQRALMREQIDHKLESATNDTLIAPYKTTYLFHTTDLRGCAALVAFTLESLFKSSPTEVILKGLVVLDYDVILSKDESIVVNPSNGEAYYVNKEKGHKTKYNLLVDPSKKELWNQLIDQIQKATK